MRLHLHFGQLRHHIGNCLFALKGKYEEMLDEVYSQRTTLSSDEYRQQAEKVGKERKKAIADVVAQLTKMEVELHVLPTTAVKGETPAPDI